MPPLLVRIAARDGEGAEERRRKELTLCPVQFVAVLVGINYIKCALTNTSGEVFDPVSIGSAICWC
eukprot:gene22380-42673_t